MFESIRIGLQTAHDLDPNASVLLHPADHPEVERTTLRSILDAQHENNNRAVIPEHRGQGGHPVLIPSVIVKHILTAECPDGLRQFWIDHPEICERIEVDDERAIRDVDYRLE